MTQEAHVIPALGSCRACKPGQDMTCGHCVATIARAVAAVDEGAAVRFDLPAHRVETESSTASAQALS